MNQELFSKISEELSSIDIYVQSISEENCDKDSDELLGQIKFCTHVIRQEIGKIKTELADKPAETMKTYDEIVEEWYEARRKTDALGLDAVPLSKHLEGYTQVFNVWKKKSTQSI